MMALPNFEDFKKKAQGLSAQLELMKDREKGEIKEVLLTPLTINDFGFLTGDDGEYVVLTFKEDKHRFYFGGSIITNHIQTLLGEGYGEAIKEHGLPVRFEEKRSKKSNRTYIDAILFPEG